MSIDIGLLGAVMQWFANIYLLYIDFSSVGRGLPLSGGRCQQVQNLCIYKATRVYIFSKFEILQVFLHVYTAGTD